MKLTVALLTILVLLAAGRDAMSQSSKAVNEPAGVTKAAQPAIEFGHEGGNLRPYKIAVFEDGRIEVIEGSPALKVRSISADKVKELVHKASSRTFWKGSHVEARPALPDFGFVFVKVRTPAGKIIYHNGAQSGRLGEFYSQLSDLVIEKP
jgi:hypothetical protein